MARKDNIIVGRYIPELDGVRAIAILLVLWWHASQLAKDISPPLNDDMNAYFIFSTLGAGGVSLFFILSGFLITGILMDTEADKNCLRKFYIRRSLRIFPLYYFMIVILGFGALIFNAKFDAGFFYYFFYIPNWRSVFLSGYGMFNDLNYLFYHHFWSLAVEEQFYLLWPILFLFLYRKTTAPFTMNVMWALVCLSIGIRFSMYYIFDQDWQFIFTWTLSRMGALVLGAILALGYQQSSDFFLKLDKLRAEYWFMYSIIAVGLSFLFIQLNGLTVANTIYITTFLEIAFFFLVAHVLCVETKKEETLRIILHSNVMKKIAKLSYGIYLIHWPVMNVMQMGVRGYHFGYWGSHLVVLMGGFIISYVFAWVFYHLFEKSVLDLKHKFAEYKNTIL